MRHEQKFLGKLLFTFDGWDETDSEMLQFYNVEFPFESMKKYNGKIVTLKLDGTMEIYDTDDDGSILWGGFPTDIEDWEI